MVTRATSNVHVSSDTATREEALREIAQIAEEIARLSADEMLASLRLPSRAPAIVRRAVAEPFLGLSKRLGRALAAFDSRVTEMGIARAAAWVLEELGASLRVSGEVPRGPLLVASNHPGAFDALALMAACARRDLLILADDRAFLRAMPHVREHLVFVDPNDRAVSARTLKRAVRHLTRGGAILQFGAGRIEADPAFALPGVPLVGAWKDGTGSLAIACARAGGSVVPAIVSGVHSARAKTNVVNRIAEARGITTLAILLQIAFPSHRRVDTRVVFGEPVVVVRDAGAAAVAKEIEQRARALATEEARRRFKRR
jgi:1-acyl-sn-glycerol-3-phosphate acyltransferase